MCQIPEKVGNLNLVWEWEYKDSAGDVLGRMGRYEPNPQDGSKEFRPYFGANGKSKGPKRPYPLYGLDKLAEKPEAIVFITEGEKSATALHHLGLVAVSSPFGSESASKADWTPLKGRKGTILPDNDEAGFKFASDVLGKFAALNIEARVCELEGLPDKGDIVDWIKQRVHGWDGYNGAKLPLFEIFGHKDELLKEVDVNSVPASEWLTPVNPAESDDRPLHDCKLINLDAVEMEPLEWLWPGRFPLGKLCLLGGKPGVGKTQISLSIAAIVTIGGKWFDSGTRAKKGQVLFLTSEDDLADTVKPRLVAAGADTRKVIVLKSVATAYEDQVVDRFFSLGHDINQLDGVLKTNPDIRLVIFDPLQAYLGVKDAHRNADVREVLGPLSDLASKYRVTVLGIEHLGKSAGRVDPMAAFLGSTGIIASARSAYVVCKNKNDEHGDRFFLPAKQNLAEDDSGLTYRLVSKTVENDIPTSCIEWTGTTDMNAREALDDTGEKRDAWAEDQAADFLGQILKNGPAKTKDIRAQAKDAGYSWRTIERAKRKLGLIARNRGKFYGNAWWWMTPEQAASEDRQTGPEIDESGGDRQPVCAGGLPEMDPENEPKNDPKVSNGKGLSGKGGSPPTPKPETLLGGLPQASEITPKSSAEINEPGFL